MRWNWELTEWPNFRCDSSLVTGQEKEVLQEAGGVAAVIKHLNRSDQKELIVDILSIEGASSAEIEGELLERESLQSSIRAHFGIKHRTQEVGSKETGMGELLYAMYTSYDSDLTHEMLHGFHRAVMRGNTKISEIGKYRSHLEPMQIVSSRYDRQTVFFEAPPSDRVQHEMNQFIEWFNRSKNCGSVLQRAAIAHVYFESIHPYEDGNGRIGRALIEKVLSQELKRPTLMLVSKVLMENRKAYYQALSTCNRSLNLNTWLIFISESILQAAKQSLRLIHFILAKTEMMNRLAPKLNARQEKVLVRMFREGPEGFAGGLSAENYISITKTSRTTTTRDLADLVAMGALTKTGQLKHTRYHLNIPT